MPILCYTDCVMQKRLLHALLLPLPSLILSFLLLTPYSLLLTPAYALDIKSAYPLAQGRTLGNYITPLLKASLIGAALIAFLIFLGGGVAVIASAGNPKQTEGGKNAITAGVIGLVLVVSAYWIVQIVEILTGLDLLNPGI